MLVLFRKGDITKKFYIVLYVDDLLICAKSKDILFKFKQTLIKSFQMVDLQEVKLFLGIRIERNGDSISMDQNFYLRAVLRKFNMTECKAVDTPLQTKLNYDALSSDSNCKAPCRNLIGCLMYVMLCTRPDLCTAINILSRYQSKNNEELWKSLKRVLRYIQGTLALKLTYTRSNFVDLLVGYVDSDWGGSETDRKSTTGYLFKVFDNCTISWNTRKQQSVAASSTEAEYMALFEGVREAKWLRSLLMSINLNFSHPVVIYGDNTACISIANNPSNHKRSKHIDIKYHFTREQVQQKIITIKYISTGQQQADVFTKPLPAGKFTEIRLKIGLK